jgi:intein/homing endonuclease
MTIESIVSTSYACTVRSYDTSKDGIEHDEAVAFADKGTRPCVRIYLEDGSHVDSTPDHRFMCADGQWRPANQLEGLRIKKGAQPPPIDLQAEMALLDTNSVREYERTMALFRILGWVLADGHIPRQGQWSVFMGHQFDVDTMLDDIELLSGTRPATRFYPDQGYGSTFRIGIPASISRLLENFDEDIMRGRRSTQPARWPMAILSDECPLPILREFVAALFGGDGSTACLVLHRGKRDQLFGLRFSQSRVKRHVRSLETYMGQLKGMLIRLGIDGDSMNITTHKVKEPDSEFTESGRVRLHANEDVYAVRLHIDVSQIEAFHERIGFRHCVHKATRLEAAVSYYRLRRTVQRQTNWVVQRAKQLSGTVTGLNYTYARAMAEAKKRRRNGGMTTRQAVHRAHDELRAMEPIYNHHYSLPSYEMVLDRLKVVRKDAQAPKMMHKHFPKAEDYLRSISADAFFTGDNEKIVYGVGRDRDTLPVMHLKVIAVKPIGERPVYDIEVAKNHNFLANGVVAHNCIISHGASQFLLERLFEQSDAYSTVVCAACGLLAVPAKPRNAPVVGMAVRGYDEPFCRVCNTGVHVREVKMPYACKLLVQELMACCIAFRFRFDDDDDGGRNNSGNASGAERAPRDEGGERADGTTLEYDDDGGLYLSSGATEETKGSPPPRLEGLGPGGSVLASVPSATLTGILDRVETAVRAASSVTNKRKRVAPRAETP